MEARDPVGPERVVVAEQPTEETPPRPDEAAPPAAPRLLEDRRYLLLCAVLVALMVSFTVKARWGSGLDIWEHAAAARELGEHPLDPGHPLFAVDRPHQFMSPYHLVVGLLARVTGLSVVTVLSWAGIANLVVFLVALWLFVTRLTKRVGTAFYALLFILFLWGINAWYFSGFLHFKVLPLVLPYPSTFAKGLTLLALWYHLRFLETENTKLLLPVVLLASVALLAHPVDAIFLYIGIAALTLGGPRIGREWNLVLSGAAVVASFLLAFLWPYFSLYDLLFGAANEGYRQAIAGADRDMYVDVLGRVWPALVVLPFVGRRLWVNGRDPLALFFVGVLLAYLFGWRTEEWSYGRLISSLALVGAVILADERVRASEAAMALGERGRPALQWVQVTTLALIVVGAFNVRNGFVVLPESVLEDVPYSWVHSDVDLAKLSQYSFLTRFAGDGDVVLSDVYSSLEVPTFGAKAVALARAEPFVDTSQRGSDLLRFFDENTSEADRRQIIERHRVSWLLLRNERIATEPTTYGAVVGMGPVAHRNERFTLVDLRVPGSSGS